MVLCCAASNDTAALRYSHYYIFQRPHGETGLQFFYCSLPRDKPQQRSIMGAGFTACFYPYLPFLHISSYLGKPTDSVNRDPANKKTIYDYRQYSRAAPDYYRLCNTGYFPIQYIPGASAALMGLRHRCDGCGRRNPGSSLF